jgi:outer membrane protein TolC
MMVSSRTLAVRRVFLLLTAHAIVAVTPAGLLAQPTSRPLTLAEAIERVTGVSESVALARAGAQRARGQYGQARSALLPQVNTSLNWQKQLQNQFAAVSRRLSSNNNGGSSNDSSLTSNPITRIFASEYNFNFGLVASQPLFTGGRATATIRAANAARESAELGISAAQAQAQLEVTQAYYDAALSDRLVTIAESTLVQTERTLKQVQLTRSVGSASEFELIRARVTRDNQRPAWLQARTQREVAMMRLKQLLDLPTEQALVLVDSVAEVPPSPTTTNPTATITSVMVNPADVLTLDAQVRSDVAARVANSDTAARARVAVRQASKGVEAAQQQLRATKAQRLPSIGLQTNYQRLAYPQNILPKSLADFFPNWTVGIGLSYPLFSGGRIRGEIVAAEAGVMEARQRLKLAEEGATLDARLAALQLTEAEAAWLASVGTAEQAQRAYDIAEVRFREGISTQLELSETRVQLQQALANRARAARDLQVARKRLQLLPFLPLGSMTAGSAAAATGAAPSMTSSGPAR